MTIKTNTKDSFYSITTWCLMLWTILFSGLSVYAVANETPATTVGSGNGQIHIIPSLAPYSIKNGETLTLSAVVQSAEPVASVTAKLGELANVVLQPDLLKGGVNEAGNYGVWSLDWVGEGLEEKVYSVTITVTDVAGNSWTDSTLSFSDPAAGISTPGSTAYLDGGITRIAGIDPAVVNLTPLCAVIDVVNGFSYFGTDSSPGRILKVANGNGSAPPELVGSLTLGVGQNILRTAVIDTASGYAYFGTDTSPGYVIKIALGAGSELPSVAGYIQLESGEDRLHCSAIDPANGYAYFGTFTTPGIVVKVALSPGDSDPVRTGAITLAEGEDNLRRAMIDANNGYAYFTTYTVPTRVVKVGIGAGNSLPTRIGSIPLAEHENYALCAIIDTDNGYAYLGTNTIPGRIVKVALGSGASLPSRVGSLVMETNLQLQQAAIDQDRGVAYFVSSPFGAVRIFKVLLGQNNNPPTFVGGLALDSLENQASALVVDTTNQLIYMGSSKEGGSKVIKFSLSQSNLIKATRLVLPENAEVTDLRLYSHTASGNVRLAIYSDSEPKNLLWESSSISNTAESADLIVPISSGLPSTLTLPAGTYWLAWQIDTTADVPSYSLGPVGSGFTYAHNFGPAPASIPSSDITTTRQNWTLYMTYESVTLAPEWIQY